ncbi:MAG: hypothetical protein JKX84_06055 [Flavobacteriales bacterium]|nr:hypothetical protein [Flavobacteriales bacterium]
MELLVAFLIAFGVVSAKDAEKITNEKDASAIITKNDLDKKYIIWEAEGDEF